MRVFQESLGSVVAIQRQERHHKVPLPPKQDQSISRDQLLFDTSLISHEIVCFYSVWHAFGLASSDKLSFVAGGHV